MTNLIRTHPSAARSPRRPMRSLAVVLGAFVLALPPAARSTTMPASPSSSAPQPTAAERLKVLVPAQVGAWKRHSLAGAMPSPEGERPRTVEAEFRRAKARVQMTVTETSAPPPAAAAVDRKTDEGSEKIYPEGTSTVRETVRRIDGRTTVALMRADGIVVIVDAIGVPPADLKALALGVKAAAR
jgi:hypothetical protein